MYNTLKTVFQRKIPSNCKIKSTILSAILTICFSLHLNSQNLTDPFNLSKINPEDFHFQSLGKIEKNEDQTIINKIAISSKEFNNWKSLNNTPIESVIPINQNKHFSIKLIPFNFFEPDFKCLVDNGNQIAEVEIQKGQHYKGIVNNQLNSMIGLSVFEDEMNGLITTEQQGQFTFKTFENSNHDFYLKIEDHSNTRPISCETDDWNHFIPSEIHLQNRTKESCKRTKITVRADYELFLKYNKNVQALSNYITGLFNNINSIYRKEEIQISLAEIIIHTTPDGFTHSTSNGDLNYLKSKYKTFNGNIQICLSGFSKNGKATLGGVAYINSLNLKSYAFAFANVEGSYSQTTNYSYDILLVAHELGHVFGSRHTHACVWGPNKNQAIDNCGPVEGSCPQVPKPVIGTLMSYCHLNGNPGIDLLLGFGKEPGDLIRNNVNSANTLSNYNPSNTSITKADQHIAANVECNDGIYSNFYFDNNTIDEKDDILIASIKKNGQSLGNLSDGTLKIIAHTTKAFGSGKAQDFAVNYASKNIIIANRYWEINSNQKLTKEISIKVNFSSTDLKEIQALQSTVSLDKLNFITISESGDANPELKYVSVSKSNYKEYKMGNSPSSVFWQLNKLNEQEFSAEFNTTILNDIGLGFNRSTNLSNNLTSRQNTNNNSHMIVFPNPNTGDKLFIEYENKLTSAMNAKIEIYSSNAQSLYLTESTLEPGINRITIPTDYLNNGVYFVKISSDYDVQSSPIIITK